MRDGRAGDVPAVDGQAAEVQAEDVQAVDGQMDNRNDKYRYHHHQCFSLGAS